MPLWRGGRSTLPRRLTTPLTSLIWTTEASLTRHQSSPCWRARATWIALLRPKWTFQRFRDGREICEGVSQRREEERERERNEGNAWEVRFRLDTASHISLNFATWYRLLHILMVLLFTQKGLLTPLLLMKRIFIPTYDREWTLSEHLLTGGCFECWSKLMSVALPLSKGALTSMSDFRRCEVNCYASSNMVCMDVLVLSPTTTK